MLRYDEYIYGTHRALFARYVIHSEHLGYFPRGLRVRNAVNLTVKIIPDFLGRYSRSFRPGTINLIHHSSDAQGGERAPRRPPIRTRTIRVLRNRRCADTSKVPDK